VPLDERDDARFDSGAFAVETEGDANTVTPVEFTQLAFGGRQPAAEEPSGTHHTADLLEALRRRRGEREPLELDDVDPGLASHPSSGVVKLVDVPLDGVPEEPVPANFTSAPTAKASGSSGATGPLGKRRGRASMPSWDEIVFGARSDDE
jgi:hypothetical protein